MFINEKSLDESTKFRFRDKMLKFLNQLDSEIISHVYTEIYVGSRVDDLFLKSIDYKLVLDCDKLDLREQDQ